VLTPTKGRVAADFLMCETGDALWLECAGGSAETVIELLRKYYFGQEVAFEDRSDAWRALSLQGPASAALLASVGAPVPTEGAGDHAAGRLGETEVRVVRWSDTGEAGFHVWVPAGALVDARAALVEAGAEPGDPEAWTVLQIEAGVAAFGRELGEETIPLEAPVEEAMSFDKGCYPGQEVIARLHVRGRPARQLRGIRIEGDAPLAPGDTLDAPEKPRAATVTASGVSPALGVVALAYVLRDFADTGTRLTAVDGRAAEVVDLPMTPVPSRAAG
jgi:folate-binding protein YgfZ